MEEKTSYVVCFETLGAGVATSKSSKSKEPNKTCQEVQTLPSSEEQTKSFPINEVVTAAVVSTATTVIVAILICCCVPKLCKKSQKNSQEPSLIEDNNNLKSDENLNLNNQGSSKLRAQFKPDEEVIEVIKRPDSPNNRSISMSPSMATTFEPELQSIMTEKDDKIEEVKVDSKFRERYSTSIPKTSTCDRAANAQVDLEKNTRFWKSCLSSTGSQHASNKTDNDILEPESKFHKNKADKLEEKFAETQEYLRRPNVLYPPWNHDSGNSNHYHTLPNHYNHHYHHHVPPHQHHHHHPRMYPPDMFGPGSYHTIAHYQLYKRPVHMDYCNDYYHSQRSHQYLSLEHDFAKTLGRTRRESPMANKAPIKLKKLMKAKMLMPPPPPSMPPPPLPSAPHHPHFHHMHHMHHHHAAEDHMKMLTWSPYSSHMMYNDSASHPLPSVNASAAGKSLDELRF